MRSWNSTAAFALFHQLVTNNSAYENFINTDILDNTSWSSGETGALATFFDDYDTWLAGYDCGNYKSVIWEEEQEDSTWNRLSDWDNHYQIVVDPVRETKYRVTVIDHYNNIVEYDDVVVGIDSNTVPAFYPGLQIDSTVYFSNITLPLYNNFSYSWDFGDGSATSALKNPCHTFPAFDSAYLVCLSVTNACGTSDSVYCDSVYVDSLHQMGTFGKKGKDVAAIVQQVEPASFTVRSDGNHLSVNIPNPFSDQTVIQYSLAEGAKSVEIQVTTILGKIIHSHALHQKRGVMVVDGSQLQDGMYYYTLSVDGVVVASKNMVVQR